MTTLDAAAQGYVVGVGDVLQIDQPGFERPAEAQVDLDGRIRVPNVGTLTVAGETLDAIEDRIDADLAEEGLVLDARSTVAIADYAPVVVMGDVFRPDRFDYIPGMTVATALGLSGGSSGSGRIDPVQVERAAAEVSGQAQISGLEIAVNAARIARLEAALTEADEIDPSPELLASIPPADRARMDALLEVEADALENDRALLEEQLRLWDGEIATLEAQAAILQDRLAVQEDLVAQAAEELDKVLELQDRGLQTSSVAARAQQIDAEARARVLELESLGLNIQRNLSEARRGRARFERSRRDETLAELQEIRSRHQDAVIRHARALEQQGILQGGNLATLMASDAVSPEFRILSPRSERSLPEDIGLETMMMPGDTLIVTLNVAVAQDG